MPHKTARRATVAQKRRIEKVRSSSNEITNTTKVTNEVHDVEDVKTLVRTILKLRLHPLSSVDTDIDNTVQVLIHIKPANTNVLTPTTTEVLDKDISKLEILRTTLHAMQNQANGFGLGDRIEIDSKGMRKLEVGDKLQLDHIGNEASNCRLTWDLTLMFKE